MSKWTLCNTSLTWSHKEEEPSSLDRCYDQNPSLTLTLLKQHLKQSCNNKLNDQLVDYFFQSMSNIFWFQLFKCEHLLLYFSVFLDSLFDKRGHVKTALCTCDEHFFRIYFSIFYRLYDKFWKQSSVAAHYLYGKNLDIVKQKHTGFRQIRFLLKIFKCE